MIQPNELRIGNIVKYNSCEWIVKGIHTPVPGQDCYTITLNNSGLVTVPISDVSPVELTEDRLLSFGFEFRKCGQDVNSGPFSHWDYWAKRDFYFRGRGDKYGFDAFSRSGLMIKSIHQLQNLYFALTGEELKTNNTYNDI